MMVSPWTIDNITALGAVWNEEKRIEDYLYFMGLFAKAVVVVQESQDKTWEHVEAWAKRVPNRLALRDRHWGIGEASFNMALNNHIKTPWTFVLSADEEIQQRLISSLPELITQAQRVKANGIYIPMRSWIEEFEFTGEQEAHLRLFHTSVGWPSKLHSRPMTDNVIYADQSVGAILHKRSLDEMMQDYLRYYKMGIGNKAWEAHNKLMMHDACEAIAKRKGWEFVEQHDWWPAVKGIAFV